MYKKVMQRQKQALASVDSLGVWCLLGRTKQLKWAVGLQMKFFWNTAKSAIWNLNGIHFHSIFSACAPQVYSTCGFHKCFAKIMNGLSFV